MGVSNQKGGEKMSILSSWCHILVEGYCLYKSSSKKSWKTCSLDDAKKNSKDIKWSIKKNDGYISPSKRPGWCRTHNKKFVPQFYCMCGENNKTCLFFSYADCDKKDYVLFDKAWRKKYGRS